jgi:hypothetical protein
MSTPPMTTYIIISPRDYPYVPCWIMRFPEI